MSDLRFINNWIAELTAPLGSGDDVLPIALSALALLDVSDEREYLLTLASSLDPREQGTAEVVRIYSSAGTTKIERGVEGEARAWEAGTYVYAGVTAGMLTTLFAAQASDDTGWLIATNNPESSFDGQIEYRRINGIVYLRGRVWLNPAATSDYLVQIPLHSAPIRRLTAYVWHSGQMRQLYIGGVENEFPGSEGLLGINGFSGSGDYLLLDTLSYPLG